MSVLTGTFNFTQHQSYVNPERGFENPVAGTYDGVNLVYILKKYPIVGTLFLRAKNSGLFTDTVDYTLAGNQITVLGAPLLDGDYFIAQYEFV